MFMTNISMRVVLVKTKTIKYFEPCFYCGMEPQLVRLKGYRFKYICPNGCQWRGARAAQSEKKAREIWNSLFYSIQSKRDDALMV